MSNKKPIRPAGEEFEFIRDVFDATEGRLFRAGERVVLSEAQAERLRAHVHRPGEVAPRGH